MLSKEFEDKGFGPKQVPLANTRNYTVVTEPNPDIKENQLRNQNDQLVVSGALEAGDNGFMGGAAAQTATQQKRIEEQKEQKKRDAAIKAALDELDGKYAALLAMIDELIEQKTATMSKLTDKNKLIDKLIEQLKNGEFDLSNPQTRQELETLNINVQDYNDAECNFDYDRLLSDIEGQHKYNNTQMGLLKGEIEDLTNRRAELEQVRAQSRGNGLSAAQIRQELKELESEQALKQFELSITRKSIDGISAADKDALQAEYNNLYHELKIDKKKNKIEISELNALAAKAGVEIKQDPIEQPEVEEKAPATQANNFSFSRF